VGVVNTSGTSVTLVSGNTHWGGNIQFAFFSPAAWPSESNPHIFINGVQYTVATVNSNTSLTLTSSAGSQSNVAYYVPSVWDGNTDATGYPCWDMPGRGKGDLLTGDFTVGSGTRVDSVTGTATWPNEIVDPIYIWGNANTWPGDNQDAVVAVTGNVFHDNRDYFQQMAVYCFKGDGVNSCGENPSNTPLSPGQSITFTGAVGVGCGAGATAGSVTSACQFPVAQPATCAAGLAGNNPGVGYWNTSNNTLYVCNPANTWTAYYTPYQYPHPLNAGGVAFSPSVMSFGNVTVGTTSSSQSWTLTNSGSSSAGIGILTLTGTNSGDFSIATNSCGSSLAAGASCNGTITFTPSATGSRVATVTEPTSGSTIALSGTGITSGAPAVTFSPTSLTFGSTVVGQTSQCSGSPCVTLTNTGTANLVINQNGVTITGTNSTDYTFTGSNTCNSGTGTTTIATGNSCAITIQFTPSAAGTRTATISVADNASGSPHTVSVTGTGVTPAGCGSPVATIGSYVICGQAFNDVNGGSVTVGYVPTQAGNGVYVFGNWCADAACDTPSPATAIISDNLSGSTNGIPNFELCTVLGTPTSSFAPHSPYDTSAIGGSVTADDQRNIAWFCPSVPVGVTSFTLTIIKDGIIGVANSVTINVAEIKSGQIPNQGYWETVDSSTSSLSSSYTATINTSGPTINPFDLVMATIQNSGACQSAVVGAGYTGITVNPVLDLGSIMEAKAVTVAGAQSATMTWPTNCPTSSSAGPGCGGCPVANGGPSGLVWFGIITPLKGPVVSTSNLTGVIMVGAKVAQ
jgi:hypothetical protein